MFGHSLSQGFGRKLNFHSLVNKLLVNYSQFVFAVHTESHMLQSDISIFIKVYGRHLPDLPERYHYVAIPDKNCRIVISAFYFLPARNVREKFRTFLQPGDGQANVMYTTGNRGAHDSLP